MYFCICLTLCRCHSLCLISAFCNATCLFIAQSTTTEPHHSFAIVKAGDLTRVGRMIGHAETVSGEATREASEGLDHGLGLMMQMEM